jgi:uncharacterized protein with PQ loop repeat
MINLFGFLMCFGFLVCYFPQIFKIYKNKSARDVSVWYYILCIVGYTSGIIYMTLTSFGIWWLLNYLSGIICCVWIIYLWNKYGRE